VKLWDVLGNTADCGYYFKRLLREMKLKEGPILTIDIFDKPVI
jgi:hypothetical protein